MFWDGFQWNPIPDIDPALRAQLGINTKPLSAKRV
jgi:hypothetical protein